MPEVMKSFSSPVLLGLFKPSMVFKCFDEISATLSKGSNLPSYNWEMRLCRCEVSVLCLVCLYFASQKIKSLADSSGVF